MKRVNLFKKRNISIESLRYCTTYLNDHPKIVIVYFLNDQFHQFH